MLNNILLFVHLLGLAMGFAGGIFHGRVTEMLAAKSGGDAKRLWELESMATRLAETATVLLIVTGLTMLWTKYDGLAEQSWLFWFKMLMVAGLVAADVVRGLAARAWRGGDDSRIATVRAGGRAAAITAVLATVAGVFNFN